MKGFMDAIHPSKVVERGKERKDAGFVGGPPSLLGKEEPQSAPLVDLDAVYNLKYPSSIIVRVSCSIQLHSRL
jgi:hypothetical protein